MPVDPAASVRDFCSGVYTLASGDRLTAAEGGFELAVPLAVESVSPAGGKRASTGMPRSAMLETTVSDNG
jgi:hypothetical protein